MSWPDESALRRDVEALAALVRKSAGEGERESARLVARRMREAGAADVRIEPYRFQSSWASRQVPHFAAGLLAAARGGIGGAALSAAALVSFDAEFSGRSQWLAPLLPAGEGANVVARVPSRGERRRTFVLVAHHDAAQTGLVWRHPDLLMGVGTLRKLGLRREEDIESFAAEPELAFALVAAGSLLGRPSLRMVGGWILAVALAASLEVAFNRTVPGANDNATGVAAVLALVERFASEPLDGTEVIALVPGCEESNMGGSGAFFRSAEFDPASTFVFGLDTLGSGEPVILRAEGPPRAVRYREEDLAFVDRAADAAGLARPRRFRLGGWTDPVRGVFAGLPTVSVLSMLGGDMTNYHLMTDTPDRVDYGCVAACARLAAATAETYSEKR